MSDTLSELDTFIDNWPDSPDQNKQIFLRLKAFLASKPGVRLEFHPRPKVTYSLRAVHENQKTKSLFAMVDVIEDQPRWLSVCFYGDTIVDPDEEGDLIPEGLLGDDGYCFDLVDADETLMTYVRQRIQEAYKSNN